MRRFSLYCALIGAVASLLAGCDRSTLPMGPAPLNSRYKDEQPAISGNGRFLAFVSNRDGKRQILLYDLQLRQFVDLPRLNRRDTIAENPSISYTARYLVYVASDRGRPEIELYDRITGRVEVLTTGYRGWVRSPSISPDGRLVAFETDRRGQWDVEILDRGPNIELDRPDGFPLGQ
ncbi:MAG: biopolymer transporter Tol [Desertifilum sp.]|nr:biopolymer transporter Tol [Desertifilum sp.]